MCNAISNKPGNATKHHYVPASLAFHNQSYHQTIELKIQCFDKHDNVAMLPIWALLVTILLTFTDLKIDVTMGIHLGSIAIYRGREFLRDLL